MELEKGEIIEIPVENSTNFTNAKQPEIGIIVLSFIINMYLLLIILYIYPGSILGFLVYKDLGRQPQITSDFFSISSKGFPVI